MQRQDRRRFLKTVGATGALLTTGTAAATPDEGKREGASAELNLVDLLVNEEFEKYEFDILVQAAGAAGLAGTLSGNRQLTVFAPTDEAFGDLLEALDVTAEELLARDDLADILQYHVTSGRRYASSVVRAPQVQMLNGDALPVAGTELNGGGDALGGANIEATDLKANNGVAHVIDGVLLP
jgi:uncharacterized surface protein with fasciclin (FAS1) repeats